MRTPMLGAMILMAGCATTTDEIASRAPVRVIEDVENPAQVLECIDGELRAKDTTLSPWKVETLQRIDGPMLRVTACSALGCTLGEFPFGIMTISDTAVFVRGAPLENWPREAEAVLDACVDAARSGA